MIYLKEFTLASEDSETEYLKKLGRTCYRSVHPFNFFPVGVQLKDMTFSDITIFSGGNGSGKSTIMNIIAEKMGLKRDAMFNSTHFFEPYIEMCSYSKAICESDLEASIVANSRIITSDDVFQKIIDTRKKNADLEFKRELIFNSEPERMPSHVNLEDEESVKAFERFYAKRTMSMSGYIREFVGEEDRTLSNGENGFLYFSETIQPNGLYLLDEPENSLSTEMQLKLASLILGMARFYDCQFIISTHSPFLLSLPFARIYDLDTHPVATCKWTDLANVRAYYDFFKEHEHDFED